MHISDGNDIPGSVLKYDKASKIRFKKHHKLQSRQAYIKEHSALPTRVSVAIFFILIIYGTNHIYIVEFLRY